VTDAPREWPQSVEPVSLQDLARLGIDPDNQLYWDGRRVEVRRRLVLTLPQKMIALLAVIASVATIFTGLNNAATFFCARNIHWLSCPAAAPPHPG